MMADPHNRGDMLDRDHFAARAGYATAGNVTRLLYRARERRSALADSGLAVEDKSQFPEPDGYLGRSPFWYADTVDEFLKNRLTVGCGPLSDVSTADNGSESGPGVCPICEQSFKSVSAHRKRKAVCSYDPSVREAADPSLKVKAAT